ncbi:MAG: alginate lyase family protein [Terracidiphilus sp.]|nr:alginate lyase family protein [Terracidiphilus sp.]
MLMIALGASEIFAAQAQKPAGGQRPQTLLLDGGQLARARENASSDARSKAIVAAAVAAADRAMREGPFSVMQKTATPPSGDRHDYMSQAPYFWPDPDKPDGLPYLRHDGRRNPEIEKIGDHGEFLRMGDVARTLALAAYLTGNPVYADRAALLLRTWFLAPTTRMNPNLEFAQGIPGRNTGRGTGIIESRTLVQVVDAASLLETLPAWTEADKSGLRAWLTAYLHWLQSSDHGIAEGRAANNHGSWYDLQVVCLELFLGDRAAATQTLESVQSRRIARQIEPDGSQPLELARTNAWGYSNFNLDALTGLATVAEKTNVDLWNYHTADGRSIRKAVEFLLPYAQGKKTWSYSQIGGFHAEAIAQSLERASSAYRDARFASDALRLTAGRQDAERLLFEDAQPQSAKR